MPARARSTSSSAQGASVWTRALAGGTVIAGGLILGGCGSSMPKLTDLNPFKEVKKPIPGKRIPVITQRQGGAELAAATRPITLPQARMNVGWTQPGGEASNAPGHLVLNGSLRIVWRADVGAGSSSYGRLVASPIVADGRVFTLDTYGRVSAFSATGGARAWRIALAPQSERAREGFGGGLAVDNGRLYVATGFGIVFALDPRTGKKLWEKNLRVPLRASPTASGDRVFVVGTNGRFFALSGADGTELWTFTGLPESARILTNVSPAVAADTVIAPYPTGELVALNVSDGSTQWTESVASSRRRSSLAAMTDPGRPAVADGVVYAVGHAGRMLATSLKSGERRWSITLPSIQTPWVAGPTVFVVDTGGRLFAIDKRDGKTNWQIKLPNAKLWSGPVLAGNRLWLVSGKGRLLSVDAATGRPLSGLSLGRKVYIAPVVANGYMYVLADNGQLIALK
ncbi:MAG: PQQ-binding-like beta-propeller repeat protein [Pseudomonadota bacterium]